MPFSLSLRGGHNISLPYASALGHAFLILEVLFVIPLLDHMISVRASGTLGLGHIEVCRKADQPAVILEGDHV